MEIKLLNPTEFAKHNLSLLHETPEPPKQLYYQGTLPPDGLTLLAVVGSRDYTTYGKQVIEHLLAGLKGYPVGIVSGLALGIDGLAHTEALRNDLYTLAVPGSGLAANVLYPASHRPLAARILEHEPALYVEAIRQIVGGNYEIVGRRVVFN